MSESIQTNDSPSDFTEVLFEDFNSGQLDRSTWKTLYEGPHGSGAFHWSGDLVHVADGLLTVTTQRAGDGWATGGVSLLPIGQTYGRYEFRAQFDAAQGTPGVVLLWPSSNEWTDEIDIIETNDPSRQQFAFTNHGSPQETQYIPVDASQWHDYTLDWLPGLLRLSVDGQVVAEMTHDVPDQPMSLAIQGYIPHGADAWWFGGEPDGSTPSSAAVAEIDWVRISEWTPGSEATGAWLT